MPKEVKAIILVWATIIGTAFGQWHSSGQFPTGHYYTENELSGLIGQKIQQPAYLIGSFIFLHQTGDDMAVFSSWGKGLTDPNGISFPAIFIGVKFHNNEPTSFHFGSAIEPNERDPLTLIAVSKGQQEDVIAVTESWSAPEK